MGWKIETKTVIIGINNKKVIENISSHQFSEVHT